MNFSLPERFDDDGVLNAIMQFQNLEDVSDLVFDFRRVGYVFPFPTLFAPMFAIQSLGGGESFSIADCAAAPALFYARIVAPFSSGHVKLSHYFDRLITITYDNFLTRSENFFYSTSIVLL